MAGHASEFGFLTSTVHPPALACVEKVATIAIALRVVKSFVDVILISSFINSRHMRGQGSSYGTLSIFQRDSTIRKKELIFGYLG